MKSDKKFLQDIRDVIYRLRYRTLKDPINKGHKATLFFSYLKWYLFYKYLGRKYIIYFQNGYKSYVYPYPDHDAGEANIFTRNVDYLDNCFIRKNLYPGDFIVDAGCNVGNRTWVLADIISGALFIDPNPHALNRARENLRLNNLDESNFFFLQKGVADKPGQQQFTDIGGASTQNAIVNDNTTENTITIDITTIDEALRQIDRKPAFIKIDVEGYDFKALQGAEQTLQAGSVRLVKFENNDKQLIDAIAGFFDRLGWRLFALNKEGAPTADKQAINKANNLFAAPATQQLIY